MKPLKMFFCLGLLSAVCACSSSPKKPISLEEAMQKGKPLVKVGEVTIHDGYFDAIAQADPNFEKQIKTPEARKMMIERLIVEGELAYQEALRRGLDQSPQVQIQLALNRRMTLGRALIEDEMQKQAKDYYEKNKQTEFERVKVAHLFFSNKPQPKMPETVAGVPQSLPSITEEDKKQAEQLAQEKAQKAFQRLKQGESWEALLAESDDKSSAKRGGDLGYVVRKFPRKEELGYEQLIEIAFKLKKDEVSEPIQAKDGWHVLKLTEEKKSMAYDEVAPTIKSKVRATMATDFLKQLKEKMPVVYLDKTLTQPESQPRPQ